VTKEVDHLYDQVEVNDTHDGNVNDGINVTGDDEERVIDDVPEMVNKGKPMDALLTTRTDDNDVAPKKLVTVTVNVYDVDGNNNDAEIVTNNELDDAYNND
jgi:hypothetical protein